MDESVDLENGDGEGPSVERNEASIVSEAGRYVTIHMECFELPSNPFQVAGMGLFGPK